MDQRVLLNEHALDLVLHRLACQLIENHNPFDNSVLIGLQPRGAALAKRLHQIITKEYGLTNIQVGFLDTTFFRDDFRRRESPLEASETQIDFLVEGKNVVLIDDVLYSGRSVRAALTAIQSFGRPARIELLVLIDRRFSRQLPIQPDYVGQQVDAWNNERVTVNWKEQTDIDQVLISNE